MRFLSLYNLHIYKVLGHRDDGEKTVFSCRSRIHVVMTCIFPCIKLTWVLSVVP